MDKVVLMYHCVYKESTTESGFQNDSALMYKVAVDNFESQVRTIADFLKKNRIPNDIVEFTFDDGGISFYTTIAPVLERHNFKGIFFVATKYIGTSLFMTKEQVKALENRGHIVGSHSDSHPENIAALDYSAIEREWKDSCCQLTDILGHEINIASIPNGDISYDVIKAANAAAIKTLYTSEPTTRIRNVGGVNLIGRYVVYNNSTTDDVLKIIVNRNYRRRIYLKYFVIRCAHKILGSYYNKLKTSIFSRQKSN